MFDGPFLLLLDLVAIIINFKTKLQYRLCLNIVYIGICSMYSNKNYNNLNYCYLYFIRNKFQS